MTNPSLLVLAAGMGNRYGGLKQMDPIGPHGQTILDYSIFDAARSGFGKIVFVIRRAIEDQFKAEVASRFEHSIPVEFVLQELDRIPAPFEVPVGRTKPWGTTQALLMAADVLHEPFAVINADDFYGEDSYHVLGQHLQSGSRQYAMIGFELRKTLSDFGSVARGICEVDANDHLQQIVEFTGIERIHDSIVNRNKSGESIALTGDEKVSMNMWGFQPDVFEKLRKDFQTFLEVDGSSLTSECYLPNSVNPLLASPGTEVKVLETSSPWFGVTYREDRPLAVEAVNRLTQNGSYPEKLWP